MTIQQLYYVLEVARTGSLNRAAKELFVSQSCISVSIRKLEQELGFPIFVRSANGAYPTEKGQRLIGQAGTIMASLEQISKESDRQTGQETSAIFRLLHMRYLPSYYAFARLCSEYENADFFQFSFQGISSHNPEDAIELVNRNACDCIAYCGLLSPQFLAHCKRLKVTYLELSPNVPFVLNLGIHHPLLKEGIPDCADSVLPLLKQYPYISYGSSVSTLFHQQTLPDCVEPNRMIHISSMSLRTDLVSHTNAFSISLPHKHPNDGVVSIPFLSGDRFTIGVLYSQIRGLGPIGQRYAELFKEELAFLSQFS